MQVPMTKIEIIGHRSELDTTLEVLHRCRSVQLIDVATVAGVGVPPLSVDPAHQAELEELRFLRVRLDAVLDLIPDPGEEVVAAPLDRAELSDLRTRLDEIAPQVEELVGAIDRLDQEKAVLPRYVRSLRSLLPLVPGLPQLGGYETTALLIESRHAHVVGELHTRLAEVTDNRFELITEQVDPDTVGAVLIFPRSVARNVFDLLGREQVSRVRLPERFEGMQFREAVAAMERRISEIPGERDETGRMLGELVKPMGEWRAVRAAIVSRIDQLEAIRHLGTTQHTFVAVGWMPRGRLEQFMRTLAENVGSRVVVEEIGIEAGDHPPVLLENPKPARPFEFLVRLLSVPAYGSIDPTTLMTFFLPLFFGIMLGDIVYGTVLLGLALWARHHWRRRSAVVADLSRIFIYGSLWSIVWGVIYGEFLGNLGHTWLGLEPIWINREEAIEPLLLFSLALGAAHITLGLVLGIWSAIRLHKPRLLLERAGTMAALIGLFVVVGAVADVLPSGLLTPAVAAVIVGVVIMGFVEGLLGMVIGPLEFVSLVGNVLSYLRIGAIGLASVYLARVANELGASGPIWVGVLIAALFHVLNLALGAFSPTIQALRLHYVEFFGKFYEEGGNAFEPFGRPLPH